jgi:poly-gamma-glutamate synthesis protein (capsule biosynthesis protein)
MEEMPLVTLMVAGDLVPTRSNAGYFSRGEIEAALDEKLLTALLEADARAINLEAPLTDEASPIVKAGPALSAPVACANGLKRLSPILSLSNNHILDQGAAGLKSTLRALNAKGLPSFGAGETLAEAAKPYILEANGLKIGLIAVSEREFSIAEESSPGANPFDPLETPDQVAQLKKGCDFVVALYHGGIECYRYPTPGLRKALRKLAEKGADLVVCQHTHCVGCYEQYLGATIVYGQGNLLFDRKNDEYWRTALVVRATFSDRLTVQYVPVFHEGGRVMLAEGHEAKAILDGFEERSREILSTGFVEAAFSRRAEESLSNEMLALSGKDRLLVKIDRRLGGRLTRRAFTRRRVIDSINLIECESLREQLLTSLKTRLKF